MVGELERPRRAAGGGTPIADDDGLIRAPRRIAVFVVGLFFLGYCVNGLSAVVSANPGPGMVLLGVGYLVVILAIQLQLVVGRSPSLSSPGAAIALLVVQGALAFLPVFQFGQTWMGIPGFVLGTALLVLPLRAGAVLYTALLAAVGVLQWRFDPTPSVLVYTVIGCAVIGLTVYGLTRFAVLASELTASRDAMTQTAVADQRLWFERELHFALARKLSEVSLLGGLALRRLTGGDPSGAAKDVERVLGIARRALADVRAIASRYRALSLRGEIGFVDLMLDAAGVELTSTIAPEVAELAEPVQRVLAETLRDAVTNVLRHGDARTCSMSLTTDGGRPGERTVRLEIVNDGVRSTGATLQPGGSLAVARDRLVAMGGTLEAAPVAPDRFRLVVSVPERDPAPSEPQERDGRRRRAAGTGPVGRLTRGLIVAVFVLFFVLASARSLGAVSTAAAGVATVACMAVILGVQLMFTWSHPWTRTVLPATGLLGVQALALAAPLLWSGPQWVSIPGALFGCVLVVFGPRRGALPAAVVLSAPLVQVALSGEPVSAVLFAGVSTLNSGVATWGLLLLAGVVNEIDRNRAGMARLAVANERVRFAQDVHDLLGLSLSSITLVGEVTFRLIERDPERAQAELNQLLEISHRALDEIYSVVGGNQELPLRPEVSRIVELMRSADIDVSLDVDELDGVGVGQQTLLVAALRESMTNMLRHSEAGTCAVSLTRVGPDVVLTVVNDGVTDGPSPESERSPTSGNGLVNLTSRVLTLGGGIESGRSSDGTYRLRVRVPVDGS